MLAHGTECFRFFTIDSNIPYGISGNGNVVAFDGNEWHSTESTGGYGGGNMNESGYENWG